VPKEVLPVNLSSVIFWTLIVLLGLAGLVVLIIRKASQHRKGLVALAKELGFTYEPDSPELLTQFKDFRLFLPNPDRIYQSAFNVLRGKIGSAIIWLFDYSYSIRNSKSLHDFTICALRSPDLKLPYFYLRHKWLTEMVNPFPGKKGVFPESHPIFMESDEDEIDFPEDETFSKKFVLQGKAVVVRPLFDFDLRQHLLPFADLWHGPSRVEGNRDTLMLITIAPIDSKAARELIQRITNLFPLLSQRTEAW
jgi:hypothetical protein